MSEPRKRSWSIRPAVHRRRLAAGRPRLPKSPATSAPLSRMPWLSDVKDLITAILVFASRSLGSLSFGLLALYRREPSHWLATLEREGRILSWTSLLVASAAIFSAFLPSLSEYEFSDLVGGIAIVSSFSGYFERLLPTLFIGFLICNVADALCKWRWRRSSTTSVRLIASTIFASSLLSCLWAFGWINAITKWNRPGPIPPPIDAVQAFSWRSMGGPAMSVVLASWFLLLSFGCALAAVRAGSRSEGRATPPLQRALRRAGLALSAIAGLSLPPLVFLGTVATIQRLAPSVAEIASLAKEPEELAQVTPVRPICGWLGLDRNSAYECVLAARTSGNGQIFLENHTSALILSSGRLAHENFERFPFRLSHGLIEEAGAMQGGITTLETFYPPAGLAIALESGKTLAGLQVVELGQPISFRLRFSMPDLCANLKFEKIRTYPHLYVRVLSARESLPTESRVFSAIGPWTLPTEMFNRCH